MTVKAKKGAEARKRSYAMQWDRTYRNQRKKLERAGYTGQELTTRLKKYEKGSSAPDPKAKNAAPVIEIKIKKQDYTMRANRPGGKIKSWDGTRTIGWVKKVSQTISSIDPETGNKIHKTVISDVIVHMVPKSGHYPEVKKPTQKAS